MAATIYEIDNARYSEAVHVLAREQVYPRLFGTEPECITYEADTLVGQSPFGDMLDGELGIDRIVRVSVKGLTGALSFTVQERFRRPSFASYRDITVTEWNHASNLPSELYKIQAQIFLYGYANKEENPTGIREALAINTTNLLLGITKGIVEYEVQENRKRQTFLSIPFAELEMKKLIVWRLIEPTSPIEYARYTSERIGSFPPEWQAKYLSALNTIQGGAI